MALCDLSGSDLPEPMIGFTNAPRNAAETVHRHTKTRSANCKRDTRAEGALVPLVSEPAPVPLGPGLVSPSAAFGFSGPTGCAGVAGAEVAGVAVVDVAPPMGPTIDGWIVQWYCALVVASGFAALDAPGAMLPVSSDPSLSTM